MSITVLTEMKRRIAELEKLEARVKALEDKAVSPFPGPIMVPAAADIMTMTDEEFAALNANQTVTGWAYKNLPQPTIADEAKRRARRQKAGNGQ